MSVAITRAKPPVPLTVVRWAARAASLLSVGLLALFAFGPFERAWPAPTQWFLIALFPVGVALGMAVAWKREILGGLLTLVSLATFNVIVFLRAGQTSPWFLAFALPGLLLLACGIISRARVAWR